MIKEVKLFLDGNTLYVVTAHGVTEHLLYESDSSLPGRADDDILRGLFEEVDE